MQHDPPSMARRATLAVLPLFMVVAMLAQPRWTGAAHGPMPPADEQPLSRRELWDLREEVREMFNHTLGSYMQHAYPWDELQPLTCSGRRWDRRQRGTLDDSLGGFSTTLVDALDTMALMGDLAGFRREVQRVARDVTFDRDVTVSVFETCIRILGGLLSAHVLAHDLSSGHLPYSRDPALRAAVAAGTVPGLGTSWYHGELLQQAVDLGQRLLPAFDTPTGIPYHRVNLRSGVSAHESSDTCIAAAGTYLLEFGTLSRLSGDARFEAVASRAARALWQRRSSLDLLGANINVRGEWLHPVAGVGAGSDSFYEYLLKAYAVLGGTEWWDVWSQAHQAIRKHMSALAVTIEVDMRVARPTPVRVSALQAFWPGQLVLHGDLARAASEFQWLMQLWRRYRALPEVFDVHTNGPVHFGKGAPLRPELVESAYFLFQATRDHAYLRAAREVVSALQTISRVKCGFAAVADVETHRLDDRMDSYFLSETLKYLFLIFDEALHALPSHDGDATLPLASGPQGASLALDPANVVMTTEGHVLPLLSPTLLPVLRTSSEPRAGAAPAAAAATAHSAVCPSPQAHRPPRAAGGHKAATDRETTNKASAVPATVDLAASSHAAAPPDGQAIDLSRAFQQQGMAGVVAMLHHVMDRGSEFALHCTGQEPCRLSFPRGNLRVDLRGLPLSLDPEHPCVSGGAGQAVLITARDASEAAGGLVFPGAPAEFGPEVPAQGDQVVNASLALAAPRDACAPLTNAAHARGRVVMAVRGRCSFSAKALHAQAAGAAALLVVDTSATLSLERMGMDSTGAVVSIPTVLISGAAGLQVERCAQAWQGAGFNESKLTVMMQPARAPAPDSGTSAAAVTASHRVPSGSALLGALGELGIAPVLPWLRWALERAPFSGEGADQAP